jgi:hypothetical protein
VAACILGERGDPAGVTAGPRRLEIGEVGERRQDRIERVRPDVGHRYRLGRQGGLPLVPAVELGEDVGAHPLVGVDDRRVVCPPPPLAQPLAGVVADHRCEVDVPG